MTIKTTANGAVVDHGYYYRHMALCPHGARVVLLNPGNSAVISTFTGKEDWPKGWQPLAKIPDWMRGADYRWQADIHRAATEVSLREQVEQQLGCKITDREFSFYMLGRSQF